MYTQGKTLKGTTKKNDSRLNQVMVLCMDKYFPLFQNFLQCHSIIFSNSYPSKIKLSKKRSRK